ncbi:MAG TPA: hypothetical protein VNH45_03475 [Gaiellaceae bacterium]|nr:hypothetical protein [Gaiellaceae bacterium]
MIFTKPSDLKWRHAPLPDITPQVEQEGHVLLVVIHGTHATLITKATPRRSDADVLEWVGLGAYAFVPVVALGAVRFYAVLRDEPYTPGCGPLADHDPGIEPEGGG